MIASCIFWKFDQQQWYTEYIHHNVYRTDNFTENFCDRNYSGILPSSLGPYKWFEYVLMLEIMSIMLRWHMPYTVAHLSCPKSCQHNWSMPN